jgi:hypothetical protein
MLFGDTSHYIVYDKANSGIIGFGNDLTHEKLGEDSLRIWLGTSKGLFSYAYKKRPNPTGIQDIDPFGNVSVYPNPTNGIFTVKADRLTGMVITDLTGKQIAILGPDSMKEAQIDLSAQPAGVYFLTLVAGDRKTVRKLILTE